MVFRQELYLHQNRISMKTVKEQCKLSYDARLVPQQMPTDLKNNLLTDISKALTTQSNFIINENKKDIKNGIESKLSSALLDRLLLTEERLSQMAQSILDIVSLEDPIGTILAEWTRPNGLHIKKIRVPLGVFGMIYEARPNVTADAIAIAIKTGNAVVLRGSASAYHSNSAITETIKAVLEARDLNPNFIQLLEDVSRDSVKDFVQMTDYLSLVIPRGSSQLIQHVVNTATVPCIETGAGVCHIYVDKDANLDKALAIIDNAKTQRPSVCNSCETVLIHESIANIILPKLDTLLTTKGVELRGCEKTTHILTRIKTATDIDWDTEYNDLILSIRLVSSLNEALDHIAKHGTMHSESIISNNPDALETFVQSVDASTVFTNASTRFADGGEFGFGAEIGISTQKLHARGPMGINELTTYKYIVTGDGQIRP
jgi:glutamate-5-semialdehyde dehydrogenase